MCQTGYYGDSNGNCTLCVAPCSTCTSVSFCLSCATNYLTNNTCVVASLCPSGTYANLTSLTCDACSANCSTCSSVSSNCTSCISPYFYFNGSCINSCPSGMFQNSTVCSSCVSPCQTCVSAAVCLSCSTNYLTNYTCVTA